MDIGVVQSTKLLLDLSGMATATTHLTQTAPPAQIRALNPRKDLCQVADLIELCFAETLDPDGKRYLNRMRRAGRNSRDSWFYLPSFTANIKVDGFVWQEDGEIVGNISLIPFISLGRPTYLIANVAVHPNYRRKGIARALTKVSVEYIQNRRVQSIWLQVKETNMPALRLYESMGFNEKARRTTWTLLPGNLAGETPSGSRIVRHESRFWKSQRKWLRQNYPDEIFWYWPESQNVFRPGIFGMLIRFFHETRLRQWGVLQEGQLRGILSWKATSSYADQLWLAAPPESEEIVLQTVLQNIEWIERAQRPLTIDYPAGKAIHALSQAGFTPDYNLIWMKL
jgi:ribosomal protein S18 acetylase RimI-like enzyme